MREWIDNAHFARWLADAVAEYIGQSAAWWFPQTLDSYDQHSILTPGTDKFERVKALNVWITVGSWWLVAGGRWTAPVFYLLYEYMRACGAPLPRLGAQRSGRESESRQPSETRWSRTSR